jgi:hypothetical protein
MEIKSKETFAFLVLVYNQESYIIEHLESIKFLIIKYGFNIEVDILINDDFSNDNSTKLINFWIEKNTTLFRNVIKMYNTKNIGTSKSVYNLLKANTADKCKITAADDVYSFENIFLSESYTRKISVQSAFPITMIDGELIDSKFSNFLNIATEVIYKKNPLLHRFKHFSLNNAPNIFYEVRCLEHINVLNFLKNFDVIEDWPIQIQISREFPDFKFELIDKVFVYYRRTANSTYIVSNKRFLNDKLKIYNNLIETETNILEKIRLISRKICFLSQNKYINVLFNLDFYIFILSIIPNLQKINKRLTNLDLKIDLHKNHYKHIKNLASKSNI